MEDMLKVDINRQIASAVCHVIITDLTFTPLR